MSGPVTVKFEGGRELDASIQSLIGDFDMSKATVRNAVQRGLMEAGQITADAASVMAPDDPRTGAPDLHTEIKVGTRLTGKQAKLVRAQGKDFAEAYVGATNKVNRYASIVEFGDAWVPGVRFLTRAWAQTKDQVLQMITGSVTKQFEKARERAARKALKATALK